VRYAETEYAMKYVRLFQRIIRAPYRLMTSYGYWTSSTA